VSTKPAAGQQAVCLVQQYQGDQPSEWVAITSIAAKIGCTAETMLAWLRQANEILRKASAY